MDYKLAKELKDAGFDQDYFGGHYINEEGHTNPKVHFEGIPELEGDLYIPTLSELIEACGDDFYKLVKMNDGQWKAWSGHLDSGHDVFGSNPTEAVARLWLVLNKK